MFNTTLGANDLPILLGSFESIQKNYHMNAKNTIFKQLREVIIS